MRGSPARMLAATFKIGTGVRAAKAGAGTLHCVDDGVLGAGDADERAGGKVHVPL
jgi:hypothetical protein